MNKKLITLVGLIALQAGCATTEEYGSLVKVMEGQCIAKTVKVCEIDTLKGCACYSVESIY